MSHCTVPLYESVTSGVSHTHQRRHGMSSDYFILSIRGHKGKNMIDNANQWCFTLSLWVSPHFLVGRCVLSFRPALQMYILKVLVEFVFFFFELRKVLYHCVRNKITHSQSKLAASELISYNLYVYCLHHISYISAYHINKREWTCC